MKKTPGSAKEEKNPISENQSITKTPRWVKVSGIIVIVIVLLAVMIMLISGGDHGPGRHFPSSIGIVEGVYKL